MGGNGKKLKKWKKAALGADPTKKCESSKTVRTVVPAVFIKISTQGNDDYGRQE